MSELKQAHSPEVDQSAAFQPLRRRWLPRTTTVRRPPGGHLLESEFRLSRTGRASRPRPAHLHWLAGDLCRVRPPADEASIGL